MAYVKGQSGNPGGRPKEAKEFRNALNVALKRVDGDQTKLMRLAEKLVEKAIDGDVAAIREVADRIDGKPHQTAEVTVTNRRASELSDDALAGYLGTGSSEGVTEEAGDTPQLH